MSKAKVVNPRVGTVRFRDADGDIIGLPRRIAHDAESGAELDRLYAMFLADSPKLVEYFEKGMIMRPRLKKSNSSNFGASRCRGDDLTIKRLRAENTHERKPKKRKLKTYDVERAIFKSVVRILGLLTENLGKR